MVDNSGDIVIGNAGNTSIYNSHTQAGALADAISIYGGTGVNCFAAGVKVAMADGTARNIQDIEIGEKVQSYDIAHHRLVAADVTRIFEHGPEEMGSFYLVIKTENGHQLSVTTNHPVYVAGEWKEAGKLKVGDHLFTEDERRDAILGIGKIYAQIPTYNIEVDKYHDYFADTVLVHNKIGPAGGDVYIYGGLGASGNPGNVVLGATSAGTAQGTVNIGSSSYTFNNELNVYGSVAIGTSYFGTAGPTNGMIVQGNVSQLLSWK